MDIRTIALMMGLGHLMQVVVLGVQFAINRTYRGIGWWLLWSVCVASGAGCAFLRVFPSARVPAILGQNTLLVLGVTFLYVGLMRFFGRRERRGVLVLLVGAFLLVHAVFLLVVDDISVRSGILGATFAAISFLTAYDLLAARTRATRASTTFLLVVLVGHGLFFGARALLFAAGTQGVDFFVSTALNVAPWLEGFVVGNFLTFGLILLLNQRSHAEMTEARDRFRLLFEASPDAVLISRAEDGLCKGANHGFEALSGHRPDEIAGRTAVDLGIFEDPADRERVVEALRRDGTADSLSVRFRRKDGSVFIGSLSARLLPLDGVPHILSVTRDVTDQRRAEEELARRAREIHDLNVGLERRVEERTSELQEANRELEALVHSIAHDLRAPLRAVDGFSSLLEREEAGRLGPEGLRFLGLVRAGSQRADRLIHDLVGYAGTGTAAMRRERVEMEPLARRAFEEAADDEVRRTFRFEVGPLPAALGDPVLLQTLLRCLLSNAVKFSLPREGRWIEVTGCACGGAVEYRVRDGGVGFDSAYADRLFGVFERLEGGEALDGTGIGLAIAKRVVTRHGGRIRAEGVPGSGAAFLFTLPAAGGIDE